MYLEGKKRLVGLFEPTYKRVRATFGGETIADSTNVMILRETKFQVVYYFPKADVKMGMLEQTDFITEDEERGNRLHWTIKAGGKEAKNAAYAYHELKKGLPDLRDYIAFEWAEMDEWWEEDEQVFGHARDPYHRVDIRQSKRHVRVEIDGETVAETERALFVFETSLGTRYYIPPSDVNMGMMQSTDTHTRCPYKGLASYWSVQVNGSTYTDYAWAYPNPEANNSQLKDHIAFYNDKDEVTVYIDGVPEEEPETVQGGH